MKHPKITLNVTVEHLTRIDELRARFPFASKHALAALALAEGLDADPNRLAARWLRDRNQVSND